MARSIVCLTFDFDAISGWIARGMTSPGPISRGEFGPQVGVPRLLALLERHGIPTSWYIPGHTLETYPDECERVAGAGHEIGHHGWTHRPPASLTRDEERVELERANEAIHKLTGRYARGYRSPSWDLSPHSVELLLEHGFVYDSSMMADDYTPYRVRKGDAITLEQPAVFGQETPLIEMPVSWTLDDYPHFEFLRTPTVVLPGNMNANNVLQNWVDDFQYLARSLEWGVITYTFHPFVIGRGHRMLALDKLIRTLKDSGAVFTTLEDAAAEYAPPRARLTHSVIALENVFKIYASRTALYPTTIEFQPSRTTVLIGPSGCGKSTLLRMIVGLVKPDTGRVVIDGVLLSRDNVEALRHRIGYVIQDGGLFPHLTAGENVALLARHLRRDATWIAERMSVLSALAGIPADALGRDPQQLSGGQRQRVGLMRALMLDPPVLLLDEPLGALDPVTRNELQRELKSIFERLGKTVIMVTHDMAEAAYFADEVVMMREGRILQRGRIEDLLERPADPYVDAFINAQRLPTQAAHA